MATLNIKGFPDDLYARLRDRAAGDHRSLAQQVIHLLSRAMDAAPRRHSVMELDGLGADVWAQADPIAYLDAERDEWG